MLKLKRQRHRPATDESSMTAGSICDETEGDRSAGGAAGTAGSDGMAGLTTSSAEEGARTGSGEGEREDGADMEY